LQREAAVTTTVPDLVPARMLNEHVYCPRLAYLEWVDGSFRHSSDTAEGTYVHRRVDRERGTPPAADAGEPSGDPPRASTSVTLSSAELGLTAKIDLLEPEGGSVVPVEYKRGRPAGGDQPLHDPELIQLCAQVILLREAGYSVPRGEAYFAETRTRHSIEIDEALVERTLEELTSLRKTVARNEAPPPLMDSPKCPRCSLVGICLPDETNLLRGTGSAAPRRLIAPDSPATPLYLTKPGSRLTKRGGRVVLLDEGEEVASRRLIDVSHVAAFGNVTIGSAAVRSFLEMGAPVLWLSSGGWLSGFAAGMPGKNIELRIRQHRAAAIGAPELAAAFIAGKIRNARTLIRRHGQDDDSGRCVEQLGRLARAAEGERSISSLLGIEGTAARIYFPQFGRLLDGRNTMGSFDFEGRNRRPPTDRINALLSFTYALLTKDVTVATIAVGFEPYLGLLHRPRFGRPALALDLAEELRPLIADSTVLTVVNNGEVRPDDFVERAGAVALSHKGRRKVIAAYERRMSTELRHPLFKYKASYRRCLEIQARLLAATLLGDVPAYRSLTTR
jgi:CRISP-associated protein Cas1